MLQSLLHICYLQDNLKDLRRESQKLIEERNDVRIRVIIAEQQQMKRLERVQGWFSRVQDVLYEVDRLTLESNREDVKLCLGGLCTRSCKSNYKFGRKVFRTLREVQSLSLEGDFKEVAQPAAVNPVDERPLPTSVVGLQSTFERVWSCVMEDTIGIVGLYGMGGVAQVGLPIPSPRSTSSKVVFTSRDFEVCGQMETHRSFKVECLAYEDACELFEEKVGREILDSHPDIPELAEIVAKDCGGLPLALIAVGRAMASKDLCSINVITTRGSPRKASSPKVPTHTDKSEYAGYFPDANPPMLKSDMKDSDCCVMGKRGILRVTPRFWGKRGCRGFVRSCFRFFGGRYGTPTAALWANVGSCVLRHGSGESVAVVPRFSGWRACLANYRRPGLLASRPLAGMALCLLQEICLADDVLVDEQDISAPVPPRTRLLRNTPVRRTLPSHICSPCLVSSTHSAKDRVVRAAALQVGGQQFEPPQRVVRAAALQVGGQQFEPPQKYCGGIYFLN
ncbi:putative disease resistance protein [Citrus sinensis]|nr:putative disease resistance protein [Citrus sinensis]